MQPHQLAHNITAAAPAACQQRVRGRGQSPGALRRTTPLNKIASAGPGDALALRD